MKPLISGGGAKLDGSYIDVLQLCVTHELYKYYDSVEWHRFARSPPALGIGTPIEHDSCTEPVGGRAAIQTACQSELPLKR